MKSLSLPVSPRYTLYCRYLREYRANSGWSGTDYGGSVIDNVGFEGDGWYLGRTQHRLADGGDSTGAVWSWRFCWFSEDLFYGEFVITGEDNTNYELNRR